MVLMKSISTYPTVNLKGCRRSAISTTSNENKNEMCTQEVLGESRGLLFRYRCCSSNTIKFCRSFIHIARSSSNIHIF
jgi:hypothetical protein